MNMYVYAIKNQIPLEYTREQFIKDFNDGVLLWQKIKDKLDRNGKNYEDAKYIDWKVNDDIVLVFGYGLGIDLLNQMLIELNTYILYHQDRAILEFKIYNKDSVKILNIIKENELPPLLFDYRKSKEKLLKEWIISRVIPSTRTKFDRIKNFEEKFKTDAGKISLALYNKCLTLSDCYWVKNSKDNKTTWKNCNFFDNNYNNFLSGYFLNTPNKSPLLNKYKNNLSNSPSLATSGSLAKAWIIDENGKRILLKNGSNDLFGENYIEKVVSDILDDCNIKHIKYWLQKFENHTYSACECGCSSSYELIPMEEYQYLFENWSKYDIEYILEHFTWAKDFIKMCVIDYVLCNEDRHWYNFGVLRNASSLQVLGLFPIYDNGMCLYHNNQENIGEMISSALTGETNNELLSLLKDNRFKEVVKEIVPKLKSSIMNRLSYSKPLQNYCLKLLSFLE